MPPRLLLDNEFLTLSYEPESKLVIFKRKPQPLQVGMGDRQLDEAERALAAFDPTEIAVLFDMREAPVITDEKNERAVLEARRRFVMKFPITAALVKTATGRLQVGRIAREQGGSVEVFLDEGKARAHLLLRLREKPGRGDGSPRR